MNNKKRPTDLPSGRFYKKLKNSYIDLLKEEVYVSKTPAEVSDEIKKSLERLIANISNFEKIILPSINFKIESQSRTILHMKKRVSSFVSNILNEYEKLYTDIKCDFASHINPDPK